MVKWKRRQRSDNLIDRRGQSGGGGGFGRIPIPSGSMGGLGRMGLPGLIIAILIIGFLMFTGGGTGIDPGLNNLNPSGGPQAESPIDPATDPDADLVEFMNFLTIDVQEEWDEIFRLSVAAVSGSRAGLVRRLDPVGLWWWPPRRSGRITALWTSGSISTSISSASCGASSVLRVTLPRPM